MSKHGFIPSVRYENVDAAIQWFQNALGFKEHVVYREGDQITHAQLILGNAMIMVGPIGDTPYGRLLKQPTEVDGYNTQSTYLILTDLKAHHDHALANGAEIVLPYEEQAHGGAAYSCKDPEGHLWNFGDYDPYQD